MIAAKIFDTGPAKAVIAISLLGFLKLLGFTGTGLAQPKPNNNIPSAPIGSILGIGSKVNLPLFFAVGSPSL
mgnify:CR=1 FL=1